MFEDIKIFAADHRKNVDWQLPYIRLGNCQSDAINKITSVPLLRHKILSEVAQAIDIKNKWKEYGSPEWLGLCHYRRFFTLATKGEPLIDISEDQFQPNMCCTPIQQLAILKKNDADMLCFARVKSYFDKEESTINNIIDEMQLYGSKVNLNMSREQLEKAFSILNYCMPNELAMYFDAAMHKTTIHCCNIFTARAEMFCQWASLLEDTYNICKEEFSKESINFNKRWFAYLSERFTSIILDAFELSGRKKIFLPLLTIDGKVHKEK